MDCSNSLLFGEPNQRFLNGMLVCQFFGHAVYHVKFAVGVRGTSLWMTLLSPQSGRASV